MQRGSRVLLLLGSAALLLAADGLDASEIPVPVSPGAPGAVALTEGRCPTFSWAGVVEAPGYELAVFRLASGAERQARLVTRVSLPAHANNWTPSVDRCLEPGGRYAWTVAVSPVIDVDGDDLAWAPFHLLEVEGAPSLAELRRALDTIERHLAAREPVDPAMPPPSPVSEAGSPSRVELDDQSSKPGGEVASREPAGPIRGREEPIAGRLQRAGERRVASAASTPTLGDASLSVSQQIHLGAGSDLFKEGDVFLWEEGASFNLGLGRRALSSVAGTATYNVAIGHQALRDTSGGAMARDGSYNVAVGGFALRDNTTGWFNTAVGLDAMNANQTGNYNVGVGVSALASNVTGVQNTAVGGSALKANTVSFNTAVGAKALRATTTGSENTAVGGYALVRNTEGYGNAALGFRALYANTTGKENTAMGTRALERSKPIDSPGQASRNAAFGYSALQENVSGSANTAMGHRALEANTTGVENVAIGTSAGRVGEGYRDNVFVGAFTNLRGDGNVVVGALAGGGLGSGNIVIGYSAGSEWIGVDNSIVIRSGFYNDRGRDNTIYLGDSSHERVVIPAIRGAQTPNADAIPVVIDSYGFLGTISSSRSVKQDVEDLGSLVSDVLDLRPVAFRYKVHATEDPSSPRQFGLIAEEVAEVLPELVVFDEEGRPETVKYHLLSSLLLGALQEQRDEIEELRARHEEERRELTRRLELLERPP